MDQIIQTVEPVRQFAKDSIRLVKRCTKPDKKRIPKDRHCNRHWICHHGIHRIFRETHPHSHQQHHCWIVDFFYCYPFFVSFFSSSKNDTITYFCTTAPYVYKFYECAASSILLSKTKK